MHFMPIGPTSDREFPIATFPERQDYEKFYTAYGECFSAWSGVEVNLLAIFMFLLQSPAYEAASSTFYSTTGFRAKLDMVEAVVKNSKQLNERILKTWGELQKTASKCSLRRNQLAHNTVFYGRESQHESRKLFIGNPSGPYKYSRFYTHDLKQIRESFSALSTELFSFWQRLQCDAKTA